MSEAVQWVLFWSAVTIGAVPLAWLAIHKIVSRDYLLVAVALFLSVFADLGTFVLPATLTAFVYPMGQCGLIGVALLSGRESLSYVAVLLLVATASLQIWPEPLAFDLFFRTTAFLSVVGIAVMLPNLGRLSRALALYFGGTLLVWWLWALFPTATNLTWYVLYHSLRLSGAVLFCWAAAHQTPRLVIVLGGNRHAA